LALKTWVHQLENGATPLPGVESFTEGRGYYQNEDEMVEQLSGELKAGIEKAGYAPRVLVMGALVSKMIYARPRFDFV
jgi:saccharopine dehydrogenase (NAD+, L-lysine-forming)